MILEKIFLIFLSVNSILGIGVFYSSQKIDIWLAYLLFHADKNNLRNSEEYFAYCKNHGMESGLNKYAISNLIRKNRSSEKWLWNLFSTLKERARDDEMLNPDQNDFKFFVMLQCFTITYIHFLRRQSLDSTYY